MGRRGLLVLHLLSLGRAVVHLLLLGWWTTILLVVAALGRAIA